MSHLFSVCQNARGCLIQLVQSAILNKYDSKFAMNTTILIHPASSDNLPNLSALWYEKAVILSQQNRRWQPNEQLRAHWEQQAKTLLEDENARVLVAETNTLLMGYIVGFIRPAPSGIASTSIGVIDDLAIDVHRYHGGVARSLVAVLRQWFAEREITHIAVNVPRRDAIAQAFWRAYGVSEWMERLWIKS